MINQHLKPYDKMNLYLTNILKTKKKINYFFDFFWSRVLNSVFI